MKGRNSNNSNLRVLRSFLLQSVKFHLKLKLKAEKIPKKGIYCRTKKIRRNFIKERKRARDNELLVFYGLNTILTKIFLKKKDFFLKKKGEEEENQIFTKNN